MLTNWFFIAWEPLDSSIRMDEAFLIRYDVKRETIKAIFDSVWISSIWSQSHQRKCLKINCQSLSTKMN